MKWKNTESDISATSLSELNEDLSLNEIIYLLNKTANMPFIVCPEVVKRKIVTHLMREKSELGGLLVGKVVSLDDLSSGILGIIIVDSVESTEFYSTSVSLTMGAKVWQDANKCISTKHFVVGWYHSHPNLGAFFSGVDRKTQEDFFNAPYHVGLVVDPIRDEEKWFVGPKCLEVLEENIIESLNEFSMV
ncbi:Mov34/MPN/PAD-1 family protein [Alteromonas macleodii]|uniref:Mov34/MPN/PAD-1 family protein n=1 Tax=Alteromonas macleodii TaxID=28108 RepID=UPI0036F46F6B